MAKAVATASSVLPLAVGPSMQIMSVFCTILQLLLRIPVSSVRIKSFSIKKLKGNRNQFILDVVCRRKTGDCPNCKKRTKKLKDRKNHMLILKHMVLSTGDELCIGFCRVNRVSG